MFDVTTGQSQQIAQHDAPIKVVKWIESPQGGVLVTGSWDKTLKVSCGGASPPPWRVAEHADGRFCSIGTCARPTLCRRCSCLTVAIRSMSATL